MIAPLEGVRYQKGVRFFTNRKFNKFKKRLVKETRVSERLAQLEFLKAGKGGVYPENDLVVSLTSYTERLPVVHHAVESLLQQSLKPKKVLLWIHECNKELKLPEELQEQCTRGLEVRYCPEDYGPYTKYYYTLKEFGDNPMVTVDDDILYPLDSLEKLWEAYQREPKVIHGHQAHFIKLNEAGEVLPYKQWQRFTTNFNKGLKVFPTGVGGVLYPPHSLHKDALNEQLFMELCPKSDDVWLKAMSLLNKIECRKIPHTGAWSQAFLSVQHNAGTLKSQNKSKKDGNDVKIARVFKHYDLGGYLD